jgi:lysophospholipase L1-like esterase
VNADFRGTIVALGDSITDGYQVSGGGDRWTDLLSERINQLPTEEQKAIVNAGISGNTVSRQPNPYDPTQQCCGAPAPVRLERDVLSVPGVTDVILLEGTNDLGGDGAWPPSPAAQVIGGIQEIVSRVHAHGLRIVGATVLPMCNPAGSAKEANRLEVNRFIRTSGIFDAWPTQSTSRSSGSAAMERANTKTSRSR